MLLTTNQAAARLNVTRPLVIRLCQQGRIKAQKVGRDWLIEEKELSKYKPRKVGRPASQK